MIDTMPTKLTSLMVDGGAAANDLLCQFQADLLGVPVERPEIVETTALGAAFMAGLGTGVWESTDDLRETWQLDREFDARRLRARSRSAPTPPTHCGARASSAPRTGPSRPDVGQSRCASAAAWTLRDVGVPPLRVADLVVVAPPRPSIDSRRMSACPAWWAISASMCTAR